MSEYMQDIIEREKTRERTGLFVGRLGDLGLGNPDGIPSYYADKTPDELNEIAHEQAQKLVAPADLRCTACIDGRCTLHNADGTPATTRLRRVGGSASDLGVALNAEASIIDTLDSGASLEDDILAVERLMGNPSAHLGGCGGANGEVDDHELIHDDLAILAAVKVLMEIPQVKEELGVGFDDVLGERVRANAGKSAAFLREKGWNGQAYVDGVVERNPHGVETLEVDSDDEKYHGHKEPAVAIVLGEETMPLDYDGFVWNIRATKQAAEKLAGQRGLEGYQQAIIADIAKHMAVCKRLPSVKTPIFLLESKLAD
jgi:hypothetical protein